MRATIVALSNLEQTPSVTSETYRMVRVCMLGTITVLPLLILPTMVGALVDHAEFSERAAGWVAGIGSSGGALAAIIIALRIRHLNPRALAVAGLLLLAAADAASAAVNTLPFWAFASIRFLSGVGGAAAYAAVITTIAATLHPERGYGLLMVFQFALSAVGLYALPLVLPVIGAEGMYLGLSGAAVLALLLTGSVLQRASGAGGDEPGIEMHMLLRPAAILVLAAIGLYETANVMHFTYAERIGVSLGLAGERVGEILGLATMLGIPAAFGVVWLSDRAGRLLPILAAVLTSMLALGLLLAPTGALGYGVAMGMLSIAWAFGFPYFQAVEASLDPGGSVVVAGSFLTASAAAVGPALAGSLVGPDGYGPVLLGAIGLYLVVTILMTAALRIARLDARAPQASQ